MCRGSWEVTVVPRPLASGSADSHLDSSRRRPTPPPPRLQVSPKPASQAGDSMAGPVSLVTIPQPDRKLLGAGVGWGLFSPPPPFCPARGQHGLACGGRD